MFCISHDSGFVRPPVCLARRLFAVVLLLGFAVAGCSGTGMREAGASAGSTMPSAQAASAKPNTGSAPAPPPAVSFDEAIATAADTMFRSFRMDGDSGTGPVPFVIDPLIDGSTGAQSKATQYIQNQVVALADSKYPRFRVHPFTWPELDRKPLVLIGTFNTINRAAEMKGERYAWWICLVLLDPASGRIVARGVARARLNGLDATLLDYFRSTTSATARPGARTTHAPPMSGIARTPGSVIRPTDDISTGCAPHRCSPRPSTHTTPRSTGRPSISTEARQTCRAVTSSGPTSVSI